MYEQLKDAVTTFWMETNQRIPSQIWYIDQQRVEHDSFKVCL